MSDIEKKRRTREVSFTLSDALKGYRGTLKLSQQQLAELTFELAAEGIVTHGIVQQHISRIEKGDQPVESTLAVLAGTIAEAFNRDGWETTPAEILKHLRNAKAVKVRAENVSTQAAKLDAMMAPLPERARTVLWRLIFGLVDSWNAAGEEDKLFRRQQSDITSRNNTD